MINITLSDREGTQENSKSGFTHYPINDLAPGLMRYYQGVLL